MVKHHLSQPHCSLLTRVGSLCPYWPLLFPWISCFDSRFLLMSYQVLHSHYRLVLIHSYYMCQPSLWVGWHSSIPTLPCSHVYVKPCSSSPCLIRAALKTGVTWLPSLILWAVRVSSFMSLWVLKLYNMKYFYKSGQEKTGGHFFDSLTVTISSELIVKESCRKPVFYLRLFKLNWKSFKHKCQKSGFTYSILQAQFHLGM